MPRCLPAPLLVAGLLLASAAAWAAAWAADGWPRDLATGQRAERDAPPPPRTAAQLLGRTPEHLRLRLGAPALRRVEGSAAEVWLYAAEACALDLVLYRDRDGRLRVAFAAARAAIPEGIPQDAPGSVATRTEAECLSRIAATPARYSTLAPDSRTASAHFATSA